jgi:hypothetical protein
MVESGVPPTYPSAETAGKIARNTKITITVARCE